MNSIIAALLLLGAAGAAHGSTDVAAEPPASGATEVSPPVKTLPPAVLAQPTEVSNLSRQREPPRWSREAIINWGGPWNANPGEVWQELYDHRYVTW
jgi:hypothetical protein